MSQILVKRITALFSATLILFLSSSCSDKRDFETYFKHTGLELKDAYVIDSISQAGYTDWTLKAYLIISDNDKKRILDKLNRSREFQFVTSQEFYYDNLYQKEDSIHAFIIDSKYYYGIYEIRYDEINDKKKVAGYEMYDLQLDTISNSLFFNYEYE